jgi:hypothetical protein
MSVKQKGKSRVILAGTEGKRGACSGSRPDQSIMYRAIPAGWQQKVHGTGGSGTKRGANVEFFPKLTRTCILDL